MPKKVNKAKAPQKAKAKHTTNARAEGGVTKSRLDYYIRETKKLRETVKALRDKNERLSSKTQYLSTQNRKLLSIISSENLQFKLVQNTDLDRDGDMRNILFDLIDLEKKEFVMKEGNFVDEQGDHLRGTLLHCVLVNAEMNHSLNDDVPMKLLEIGGKEAILSVDSWDRNSFYLACRCTIFHEMMVKMIEIGGKDLALAINECDGSNGLHNILYATDLFVNQMCLLEFGGKEAALQQCYHGNNALHVACKMGVNETVIEELINIGGSEIMSQKNGEDHLPIHSYIMCEDSFGSEELDDTETDDDFDVLGKMFCDGIIKFKIGGEFGFAGLFDFASYEAEAAVMNEWYSFIGPALMGCCHILSASKAPILQSVLIHRAPPTIVKFIVLNVKPSDHVHPESPDIELLNFVSIKDSLGRYPIDVAVELGVEWDEGLHEIVEEFASAQGTNPIHLCAKHGVTWEGGMENALEGKDIRIFHEREKISGLYLFMLAAATGTGMEYDLGSVFQLIKKCPDTVQVYKNDCADGTRLKKEKRRRSRRLKEMNSTRMKQGRGKSERRTKRRT